MLGTPTPTAIAVIVLSAILPETKKTVLDLLFRHIGMQNNSTYFLICFAAIILISIGYIFAADSLGLSWFKLTKRAPKDAIDLRYVLSSSSEVVDLSKARMRNFPVVNSSSFFCAKAATPLIPTDYFRRDVVRTDLTGIPGQAPT